MSVCRKEARLVGTCTLLRENEVTSNKWWVTEIHWSRWSCVGTVWKRGVRSLMETAGNQASIGRDAVSRSLVYFCLLKCWICHRVHFTSTKTDSALWISQNIVSRLAKDIICSNSDRQRQGLTGGILANIYSREPIKTHSCSDAWSLNVPLEQCGFLKMHKFQTHPSKCKDFDYKVQIFRFNVQLPL